MGYCAALILAATVIGVRADTTVSHPDSQRQSLEDGCNRSQLGLLGEAAATMKAGPHPTPLPNWVYVDGDDRPTLLEGTVLGTHTAGTDLFGVHETYDLNIDVSPDAQYQGLLSSRNDDETPPQIHTEWESGKAPLFAWPSAGDRVRETGSEIWDCGHWQGTPFPAHSDLVPGDPAGTAEGAPGEEIEIHPISELATFRQPSGFVPTGRHQPVEASRLDVAISNQGGRAKGVEECALLAPAHPANGAQRIIADSSCSQLQDVTRNAKGLPGAKRDYSYDLYPPGPPPVAGARVMFQQDLLYRHRAPDPSAIKVEVLSDHVHIVVPFSQVAPTTDLQDFGATWHAWWSSDSTELHHFRVTVQNVTVNDDLDQPSGDIDDSPTTTDGAEWNMYTEFGSTWTDLHDPPRLHGDDYMPALGSVPPSTPDHPQVMSAASVPPVDLYLPSGGTFTGFTDSRVCDQPGYIDCPADELGQNGKSTGRTDLSLPVDQLVGASTTVTIHPHVCGPTDSSCPEQFNDPTQCPPPGGCYSITYRIDDLDAPPARRTQTVSGDGTATGTTFSGTGASQLSWWIAPTTRYSPAQEEENAEVRTVIAELQTLRPHGPLSPTPSLSTATR